MTLTNPHIIFKSIEGKIKAGVVELPKESDYNLDYDKIEYQEVYDEAVRQALANPIFFKEEKDAIEIRTLLVRQEELKNENWDFELDKPYKIEVEIEIKEDSTGMVKINESTSGMTFSKFAFIKKDVFDTDARLPEQKEESQEKLINDFLSLQSQYVKQGVVYDGQRDEFIKKAKSKFTLTRKS